MVTIAAYLRGTTECPILLLLILFLALKLDQVDFLDRSFRLRLPQRERATDLRALSAMPVRRIQPARRFENGPTSQSGSYMRTLSASE